MNFWGFFANGAFQLLNPLRAMAGGQFPGRDFPVFHGVGLPWLHYPFFIGLGGDLRASEAARQFVPVLLHSSAAVYLALVIKARFNENLGFFAGATFFILGALVMLDIFLAGNSSLGVRSAFPIFVGIALLSGKPSLRVGVLLSLCAFVSFEHGLSAFAAFLASVVIIAVVIGLQSGDELRAHVRSSALALLFALTGAIILISAGTAGSLYQVISYGYHTIPSDQFWYFGVSPNQYLAVGWDFFIQRPEAQRYFVLLAIVWATAIFSVFRQKEIALAMLFLAFYATIGAGSQLGILEARNLIAAERASILAIIIFIVYIGKERLTIPAGVLTSLIAVSLLMPKDFRLPILHTDGYLSEYWQQHINSVEEIVSGGSLWSIYAGLPELMLEKESPSVPYIIHALGEQGRLDYVQEFKSISPDFVRLDNASAWGYGDWLLKANWLFFREVFRGYELVFTDRYASIWEKKAAPTTPSLVRSSIDERGCGVFLSSGGLFTVEVKYGYRDSPGLSGLDKTRRLFLVPNIAGVEWRSERVSIPDPDHYPSGFTLPVFVPYERHGESREVRVCPFVQSAIFDESAPPSISEFVVFEEKTSRELNAYLTNRRPYIPMNRKR